MSETPPSPSDRPKPEQRPTRGAASGAREGTSRVCHALLAAVLGAACASLLEARSLSAHYDGGVAMPTSLGLLMPWALVVGVLVGTAALLLWPRRRLGVLGLLAWDRKDADARRVIVARCWLLLAAALLWLLSGSRLALGSLLEQSGPVPSAAAAALGLGLSGALLCGAALAASVPLARRLPDSVRPSLAVGVVAALGLVAVVVLSQIGETSGAGGAWRMFGVLRREELDLRPVLYLLLMAGFAYQLPAWMQRFPAWLALVFALAPLATTWGTASWLSEPTLSMAVERSSLLGKLSLKQLRAATDRDGDGFASHFGGGDCNDADAAINPLQDDIEGNGIDEDCSGSDAELSTETEVEEPKAPEAAPPTTQKLPEKLNVVLITVDTLRYDISFTGYPRKITPNIDALAARSTYYDRAYALASYTAKSIGPMLIGRYGSETHRGKLHFSIYQPLDKMLQEHLQAGGVRTVSVQAHWYFKPNTGLGRGFDVLDMSAAPEERQGEGDRTITSPAISDAAIKQLSDLEATSQPFFMWVHYLDPHAEYVPHEAFDFGTEQRDLYDGEVAFTDHHVGRVLDAIARSPFADNTAIIVTSDHGESFGEHGMNRHGFELWDVLVRVPLLVHVPGAPPKRVTERRSLIDIAPTVLDMFDLPLPDPKSDDALRGTSLVRDVLAGKDEPIGERPIFIDMPGGPFVPERQAFIEDDLKLITSKLRPMGLYDLAEDPGELDNLVKEVERTKAALERMKKFRRKLKRVVVN